MMIGISLAVTAPRGGRVYDFTETHAFTAAAETSTADQTGLDFLQDPGVTGTSITHVNGAAETFPFSNTLWTINANGTATFKPGSVYQYIISGDTRTASIWVATNAGEKIKYNVTITGSYVAAGAHKPEDSQSYAGDSDPTGTLTEDLSWRFAANPYFGLPDEPEYLTGTISGTTADRTGGAAGTAFVMLYDGDYITYSQRADGAATFANFSAQGVFGTADGTFYEAADADGMTLTGSISSGTATITAARSGYSDVSVSRAISGDVFTAAVRIANGTLGLLVNGDASGAEDTADVSAFPMSGKVLYTRSVGVDVGREDYGWYLRQGDITAVQSADYMDTVTAERQPTSAITAKSVVFKIADNHGHGTLLGVRSIEFKLAGVTVGVTSANCAAYATSSFPGFFPIDAFDEANSKTGTWNGTSWIAANTVVGNQKLIVVFNSAQTFDEVVVNNNHTSGTQLNTGAQNVEIIWSPDAVTDTVYGNAVSNGTSLGSSAWAIHAAADTADDQTVWTV